MFEDDKAVIKVHDHHCIDLYVSLEVYNAIRTMRPDMLCCMDGLAIRCKDWDPPS